MKRKIIITFLCLTMGLSIVACGNKASTTPSTEKATATESNTEVVAEVATESTNTETSDYIAPVDATTDSKDSSTSEADTPRSETGAYLVTDEDGNAVLKEEYEIENSKWADINGKWDAVHQYGQYAASQGADGMSGWTWCYIHGKGAGDKPSYAVYMKEGDPDYGKVFHVGDTLPDGTKFNGTMEEYAANMGNEIDKKMKEYNVPSYTNESGETVYDLDAWEENNSNN